MASVNKVILIGNLGKDPEIKYTQGGMAVAHFSLATTDRVKDKDGNWQDRTEWHNIVLFERKAEIAGEYLKKGGTVYIEGSIRTNSWDDKETGQKKYRTEIIGNQMVLLGGPREGGGEGGGGSTAADDRERQVRRLRPAHSGTRTVASATPAPKSQTKIFRFDLVDFVLLSSLASPLRRTSRRLLSPLTAAVILRSTRRQGSRSNVTA